MNMTPEAQARHIQATVEKVLEIDFKPIIHQWVEQVTTNRLVELVQYHVRQETNRPWRWHFKIGRTEVALRRVRD